MKILYAIQGTGNGHVSRAREVIPYLIRHADTDVLLSGSEQELQLNYPVKYRVHGLGYIFGKKGGIDYMQSLRKAKPFTFLHDVFRIPVQKYDLVLNDFEPVTAWACKFRHVPCLSFSHQSALLSKKFPRPKNSNGFAQFILRHYAPANDRISLHFRQYDDKIVTPVIRTELCRAVVSNLHHVTVYLPAYKDELLINYFSQLNPVRFEIFSKRCRSAYKYENIHVNPVNSEDYTHSLITCTGLICGGGFEAPAEALHLGKKLLVIPMKGQYEQQCNAEALNQLGVTVLHSIDKDFVPHLTKWYYQSVPVLLSYPHQVAEIVRHIIEKYEPAQKQVSGQEEQFTIIN